MVGPFDLPAKYVAAGALFPSGRVLLWGESRHHWLRIFRLLPFFPLINQSVKWAVFDAAKGPTDADLETPAELQARVVNRGEYEGEPSDPRSNVWCAGNAFLPDGTLLVVGGDAWERSAPDRIDPRLTLARTVTIRGHAVRFARAADMNQPRWYPGLVQLPDGRMLASFGIARNLEAYDPVARAWSLGPSTTSIDPMGLVDDYPWTFVMPDGTVLMAGAWGHEAYRYDPAGGSVSRTSDRVGEEHPHGGGAVLLAPAQEGKILVLGGGTHEGGMTNKVERYDFSAGQWSAMPPMRDARHHFGVAVLPTGTVFVAGGGGGRFHPGEGVGERTELFDPDRQAWTPGPPLTAPRGYHEVTLLLPDASLLVAGEWPTAEVYYPAYFFRGPRPVLRCAPEGIGYAAPFSVDVVEQPGDPVDRVVAVRQGAMTHSYNFDQRIVALAFSRGGPGELTVTGPASPNHAPPGYYLLFAISRAGLPSRGSWVRIA
ncbi:MAG TPA: galactose oxidase-like domain-containing protein [Thermoplasmata archaeon]|nr:galactose oxidase-like domain-containing protein [Thermoplasmata archaeon]